MLHRTEGIVLKTGALGEADLIVTFLTRDLGVIKTFAKSPRKIKSRFGSSLEPLTYSTISFWGKEDASLPRLTQCDILHPFDQLRSELKVFLCVSEITELTLNFIPERDASKKVFSLFLQTLRSFETGAAPALLNAYYKIRLLEAAGYVPRLKGCGRCGKQGESFYLSHGTVLCDSCSGGSGSVLGLAPGVVRLFETLLGWDLTKIGRLKPADSLLSGLLTLIDEHMKYILEKGLRTKTFRLP